MDLLLNFFLIFAVRIVLFLFLINFLTLKKKKKFNLKSRLESFAILKSFNVVLFFTNAEQCNQNDLEFILTSASGRNSYPE